MNYKAHKQRSISNEEEDTLYKKQERSNAHKEREPREKGILGSVSNTATAYAPFCFGCWLRAVSYTSLLHF